MGNYHQNVLQILTGLESNQLTLYIRSANEKTVCLKCVMRLKFNVIFLGRKVLCHGNYFV